ncbi:hypothetical protein Agabi119p4_4734 [Agaricus bisporus var. burnettii]|uniref:GAR domain-containing protein n=1 Tax=Agaricus bisporus var. burnettii TaxID=192524 RepID=A0A8H7KHK8_AGABI|nr:hypothetical protein Agabi119p4_4734 [Agaricus bisporus var. burnettii]
MSNTASPSSSPQPANQPFVVQNPTATASLIEPDVVASVEPEKRGEEEALESHEVIELQAFSEKKPWIEERIKLLDDMPPINAFVGLDAIRISAETVPGLPTRALLEEWIAKHDAVDRETEIFDTVELEKLRQLTKAATHRNLSPADTDVIELTLTTIFSLDRLLQLLRDRSESLDLLSTRITWEEHRSAAWVERRTIIEDFTQFIMKRARWNVSIYESPMKEEYTTGRRGSINSFASVASDSSTNIHSAAYSRSARFKLAELLSRDAAHFGSRVTTLRHGSIASAGKALDKLIDISRSPVPEELLDEQDRIEEKGINELEQIGKFAMSLVMQWRKADEIHVETMKDQTTAQNLLEEIETAKLHHPTQRQCNSFISRAEALLKRLSVRVNPVVTPQFFPHPTHPLFEDQRDFNSQLAQMLAAEIQMVTDLVNKAHISAKQYQTMYEAVKRLDVVLENAIKTTADFKFYLKQLENGVSSKDGDGSAPNLSTERCLDSARHTVFLALWPSVSEAISEAVERTNAMLPEFQISLTLFDASGVRDPEYRKQAVNEVQQLRDIKEEVEAAYRDMLVRLDYLRRARRIASSIDGVQQEFVNLRLQITEAMERTRWRQDSLGCNMPLTPDSAHTIIEDTVQPPVDFSRQLAIVEQRIVDEVDSPYFSLSRQIEPSLKEYFARRIAAIKAFSQSCGEMINTLAALQRQASVMSSVREECHSLQLRIEDAKVRSAAIAEGILHDVPSNDQAIDDVAEFHVEADCIQELVRAFTDGLVFKVPFITRQSPSASLGGRSSQRRSLSIDPATSFPGAHERHFDLPAVDAAVRADCNAYTIRLAGEVESLLKCKHHLALAHSSKDLDAQLTNTIGEIYSATQEMNGWKAYRDRFARDESYLESLNFLLKTVEDYLYTYRKSLSQRFPPHRELLRQMESLSATLDQPIREALYIARVRGVDDAELRFNTWVDNASSFKNELDQAIRSELFRLNGLKEAEERLQKEEALREKAEEEERRRLEEEQRLKEEAEREEAARIAEETRIHQEKKMLATMEAEKLRLEQERIEAEMKAMAEKQKAEADRLHLERQYNVTMEAERLLAQKQRDELSLKLRRLEEELNATKRLQRDQQRTSAEQTAKTVSELENQRRDLEDLLKEYRDKLGALKTLESEAQRAQTTQKQSKNMRETQTETEPDQDVFVLEVSPDIVNTRTEAMSELENRIHALRRRLSALGLKKFSDSSVNLPTDNQVQTYDYELTKVQAEDASLPVSVANLTTNAILRSFRTELRVASEQMERLKRLAELNSNFQICDTALSDLLEHIDSYPALPSMTMSSFSDSQVATPEDQLSARIKFTNDTINTAENLVQPFLDDSRASAEHSRITQTWDELRDMANDKLRDKKSRPGSAASTHGNSGRNSVTSIRTGSDRSSQGKKATYSGISNAKPSHTSRGRLLAPPPPIQSQRRVVSGGAESSRSSSRMSVSSARATSGSFNTSLYQPTFASRQRTTSLSSNAPSAAPSAAPPLPKRVSQSHARTKPRANSKASRPTSPVMSEFSRTTTRSSRPSLGGGGNGSTWARAPRNSLSFVPPRPQTPKREKPPVRRKYVPNPKSKLDVAVGDVVNNLPMGVNVEGLTETWKDQSGKYWIGNSDPKLCFCRILRSQTVMVRVGGGWQELSKFINNHIADSFRMLPESPSRARVQDEKWISSTTLLEAAEISDSTTKPPPMPPRTPEPKFPFVPSFSLLTPSGQSPRSIGSSPSTKSSPLTPLQFMRRAGPESSLLRPVTPTKQSRVNNPQSPLRLWRP